MVRTSVVLVEASTFDKVYSGIELNHSHMIALNICNKTYAKQFDLASKQKLVMTNLFELSCKSAFYDPRTFVEQEELGS